MISNKRVLAIQEYMLEHGEAATAEHFQISTESVHRYIRTVKNEKAHRHPKIALIDVETLPLHVKTFSLYPKYIDYKNIIKDMCMLSWSFKWLYSSEIKGEVLTSTEAVERDDKRIIQELWKLMDAIDVGIMHNGDRFDVKIINARFLANGLPPVNPFRTIDTLKVLRNNFKFTSNRLDYIGDFLVKDKKIETNFSLWDKCDDGDEGALRQMLEYNKQDVNLLEEVFLVIRPYLKSSPNIAIYSESDGECCPICGSQNLQEKGYYSTNTNNYESLQCKSCHAYSRRRKGVLTKKQKDNLLVPISR